MIVTERNLEILSALEKWGVMELGQLDGMLFHKGLEARERLDLFFKTMQRKDYDGAAYKAMARLEKGGYVREYRYTNLKKVYTLSSLGHGELRERDKNKFAVYRDEVVETLVKHELLVSGIGLVMSELLGLRVSTEFERQVLSRGHGGDFPLPDLWITDAQ